MSWLAILALAVAGFAFAAFVLKLPRSSWTLFAAAQMASSSRRAIAT